MIRILATRSAWPHTVQDVDARAAPVVGTRQWQFHSVARAKWQWRLVDAIGRTLILTSRRFPSYLDCVENARQYGYRG